MRTLAIIHFSPLELYPPIQNLLRELEKKSDGRMIYVFTTTNVVGLDEFVSHSAHIRIFRAGISGNKLASFARYFSYFNFYVGAIFNLIAKRPGRVLYFETISSFPAYVYKRFFNLSARIYIHYHEYTSPAEYAQGMKLVKFFHRLELRLYPKAVWVSHTNTYRMEKFKSDIGMKLEKTKILPNFPPRAWFVKPKPHGGTSVKVVYVGALSMDTMYTREFANWVILQNGKVSWDIYSYNCTAEAKAFLTGMRSEWIKLHPGINYEALPSVLNTYSVGVILYNGHIPNYVYNAPNKLFEYLACGLSVWFPVGMTGSLPYVTKGVYPEVIAIDFKALENRSADQLIERHNLKERVSEFYSENALSELIKNLVEK